jgi:hypothetical protein
MTFCFIKLKSLEVTLNLISKSSRRRVGIHEHFLLPGIASGSPWRASRRGVIKNFLNKPGLRQR